MKDIQKKYEEHCNNPSDINEHLPTLLKYAKECNHITEMGVRWVSSTWALLVSNPKKMISYDINQHKNVNEVLELAKKYKMNYSFIISDVLKIQIEETDLLFIDTLHTYNQLIKELELHSDKALKYIILHDTTSFGTIDEKIYKHASPEVKNQKVAKQGLWNAILDFLETEKGKKWTVLEKYENNNGLTVLKRQS
jgi:hypothetical protein